MPLLIGMRLSCASIDKSLELAAVNRQARGGRRSVVRGGIRDGEGLDVSCPRGEGDGNRCTASSSRPQAETPEGLGGGRLLYLRKGRAFLLSVSVFSSLSP